MASKDYLKLCNEAQKKKLKLAKKQQQDIKNIYQDMYLKVSKKLNKVNPESLTERYLEELKKELEKEIRTTNNNVGKVIKNNIEESSKLANNVQLDFFMQINEKYSLNMKDTFASMFSKIPQNAMDEILFGDAYKDRKGLSERIWQHTKKFNKDIDYIIAQGIGEKKSAFDIAKDLEKYIDPNVAKDWEWNKVYPNSSKKVDYNAQRLARTAVNHAFQQAQKRSCDKNPYVTGIRWRSAQIHGRTCKLCQDRHDQVFKVEEVPLDHPNGICTTIPEIPKSLEDIGTELRDWIDGKDNFKLDEWYSKYGEGFSGIKTNNKDKEGNTGKNKADNKLSVSKDKNSDIISSKKWLNATFSSQKKFEDHFKHLKEYNNISPEEYLNLAREFLSQPLSDDVEGFINSQGWLFKYRKSTNDFAMGHPKGTISTLFKPDLKYDYWLLQIEQFKEI